MCVHVCVCMCVCVCVCVGNGEGVGRLGNLHGLREGSDVCNHGWCVRAIVCVFVCMCACVCWEWGCGWVGGREVGGHCIRACVNEGISRKEKL